MAHGSPRIEICRKCKHYTLVPRFSADIKCPSCHNPLKQITKEQLIEEYKISIFKYQHPNFNQFTKLK